MSNLIRVLYIGLLLTVLSCSTDPDAEKLIFQDPLNGESVSGWNVSPNNFIDHSTYGKVYKLESTDRFIEIPPYVGDESWKNYRVEIDILSKGGQWVGLDCLVQDDQSSGLSVCFFKSDSTAQHVLEAMGFFGGYSTGAGGWKLWPISQRRVLINKDEWVKYRIDVGENFVNAYVDDFEQPVFTVYDPPHSSGGVRLFSLRNGEAYLRNLRITQLSSNDIKPILEDEWKTVRGLNVIRDWEVTSPQSSEFGLENIPEEINNSEMNWIEAGTDERGVVNLSAMFPEQNTKGTVFARTVIDSDSDEIRKAWVTYTDRCMIWCNGKLVFKGPNRGWNDPESNHDCRLKPDNYEFDLPLQKGENVLLLRSEVIERWGWAFWMRLN